MKNILYLFLLLVLPVLGFSQSRYGVEGVPMCWTISGKDSSIVRYVLISSTGKPVKTVAYENAQGAVINVSGGVLRYGFCDCAGGLDSLTNSSVTWSKLASPVKDSINKSVTWSRLANPVKDSIRAAINKVDTSIFFTTTYNLGTAIDPDKIKRRYKKITISGAGAGNLRTLILPAGGSRMTDVDIYVIATEDTIAVSAPSNDAIFPKFNKVQPNRTNNYQCFQVGAGIAWRGSAWDSLGSSPQLDTFYVLGIGQSNMIGRPDTSVTKGAVTWDSIKNSKVLVFNLEINKWQVANKLNCHGTWGDLYGGVPVNNAVWQFCKELQRRTKAVIKYVISARGGRALSYWTGGTYPMTGEGKDSLIAQVARSGIGKFDVVIWDQGESDISNASYETQFRNFFLKDIRNRSWFDSYKPVIITGMPVTNANYIPFNERLIKLTDLSDPYLTIAQTDSLALVTNDPFSPADNVHFTGVSLQQLGARYFNAFINTPKAAKSGLFDLAWRDVLVNAKGNTLRLDSLDGVIDVAADKRFYIQKTEPGWAGRFEPYQYFEYTANGDPRVEFQSFVGNDLDAPGNITQNLGYPRLGSFHFRGWLNGAYRRGASIAVYPDSVWGNLVSGMMRFTTVAGGNGFNISETIMSLSQRGHAMGPGIVKPDSDAAWQVDQSNRSTYYFNGASRTYSKFKNTIFGIQDASVYSLVHNPFVDTTLIRGSARFVGPNTTVRIGKSEYADNGNIETGLDIISKYTSSWDSRLVMNPYGYLDLYSTESSGGGNPRFYFFSSRGNSQTTKLRNQPNDYVGFIDFAAYNGSSYHTGAVIGTTISANSAAGSSRFSQMMFFGIDKSGTQPHISSNWVMALDTNRCYVPRNFQAGGLLNGTTASLFVNNLGGGNVGVGTVSPTSKLHIAGSFSNMVTTISSATTLGEHTVVFATGASTYLVTLPGASTCVGRRYMVKVNGGAKTISSYLDLTGSASTTLANNSVLNLISDGTNWQQL